MEAVIDENVALWLQEEGIILKEGE